jgi:hypothetical protein
VGKRSQVKVEHSSERHFLLQLYCSDSCIVPLLSLYLLCLPSYVKQAKKDKPDTGKWIHTPGALDIRQIVGGTSFGKPPITEEEMEAILTGGANIAPEGSMKGVWRAMRRG